MNEEEKKAIEKIKKKMDFRKNVMKDYEKDNCLTGFYYELKEEVATYETILNLIENQQKELDNIKEIEKSHKEENGKLRVELEQQKEKNKEVEEHQRQYLDGELITAKQGKFFEKMIKENYIRKDKIKELLENEIIDISGFRCIAVEDIQNLLEV